MAMVVASACTEAVDDIEDEPNSRSQILLSVAGADQMTPAPAQLALQPIFEIGSLQGEDALGIIEDVAISSDSVLAVTDRMGCRILLFDYPSGTPRSELGRCGEGPGEFLRPGPVAFKGDTLVVYDLGRRKLIRLDLHGNELRSQTPLPNYTAALYWRIDARPSHMLLTPAWMPRGGEPEMLVLANDRGDTLMGLRDTKISLTNRENISRSAEACLLQRGDAVAVANKWAVQAALLDEELDPIYQHHDTVAWFGPRPASREGGWTTGFYPPAVACSDTLALWQYRKNDFTWEDGDIVDRRVEKGILLVATASGKLVYRETVADTTWPHVSSMIPVAALGDVFFFFQNNWGPFPMVRGYRVTHLSEGGS